MGKVPPECSVSVLFAALGRKNVHGARVAKNALVQALNNDGKGIPARWTTGLKGNVLDIDLLVANS